MVNHDNTPRENLKLYLANLYHLPWWWTLVRPTERLAKEDLSATRRNSPNNKSRYIVFLTLVNTKTLVTPPESHIFISVILLTDLQTDLCRRQKEEPVVKREINESTTKIFVILLSLTTMLFSGLIGWLA